MIRVPKAGYGREYPGYEAMFGNIDTARISINQSPRFGAGSLSDLKEVLEDPEGIFYRREISRRQWGRWLGRVKADLDSAEYGPGIASPATATLLGILAMELAGNQHQRRLQRCSERSLLDGAWQAHMDIKPLFVFEPTGPYSGKEVYAQIVQASGRTYSREYLRKRIGLKIREIYQPSEVQNFLDKLLPPMAA